MSHRFSFSSYGCFTAFNPRPTFLLFTTLTPSPPLALALALNGVLRTHNQIPLLLRCISTTNNYSQLPPSSTKLNPTNNGCSALAALEDHGFTPTQIAEICSRCPNLLSIPYETLNLKLDVFGEYGFTATHLTTIFCRHPNILSADTLRVVKPKLDLFVQNGISGHCLHHTISSDAATLNRSLERFLIPFFNFLKTFFSDVDIVSFLSTRRGIWFLHNFSGKMASNVETLRSYGVPDCNIVKLFLNDFQVFWVKVMKRDVDEFREKVRETKKLGFDPSSMLFLRGLGALTMLSKEKWELKVSVFKKTFGWKDEQEVMALFVKQPQIMQISVEKLEKALEFFTKTLEWTLEDIAKYPSLLASSLEHKILPRFSVLRILSARGLVKKSSMGKAYQITEANFLTMYVKEYEDTFPRLLEVYNNAMDGNLEELEKELEKPLEAPD